jgi:predicted Zn-dependent protease
MRYIYIIATILILFYISGCALSPVTGKREFMLFSDTQEIELGKNSDPDIRWEFGGLYRDSQSNAYVNTIGQKVASVSQRNNIPYHFAVVDTSVLNAFALPGGYVYITRGLLAKIDNEAQLAAVLGHEIGHVNARHSMKNMQSALGFQLVMAVIDGLASTGKYDKWRGAISLTSNVAFSTVSLGYSRSDEFQADELGTSYATKAGYDPEGMIQLLELLKSLHDREPSSVEVFFMSHPKSSDRIKAVNKQISQSFAGQNKGVLNQNTYESKLDDLKKAQKAYDHYDKAEEYRSKGKYQEALSEYNAALKIRNISQPHYGIGLIYSIQGNHNQAIDEYKKALGINPEYIFAYNDMGTSYMAVGRNNDAASAFKEAVRIYENYADAHANLGEAYYKLKQYPEATKSLELAVSLNPNHPKAHTNLGLVYEATGNKEKAIQEYETAIQVAPKDKYTDTARQRLTELKKP